MLRRDAVPCDICKIAGDMIEDSGIEAFVVREGQKARARTDACADDADALKAAMFFEPCNGGARVQHGLPH
jgi:hypothetical protein